MLKVKNISYQKDYNILFKNLTFQAKDGVILHVFGINGSGKTSLLKILAGISTAEKGSVSLDEHDVKSFEYKKQIFYFGHLPSLNLTLSSIDNLNFLTNLKQSTNKILLNDALNKIGLKGYENEYCYRLSAGQRRRVVLAGLFLSKAKLWLLDEPFTALDKDGIEIVKQCINNHCKNNGICIIVSHQDNIFANQEVLEL
jgi:heme exporter protein A